MTRSPRSIRPKGIGHGASSPIPTAARLGPLVASGGILPRDPETGEFPEGIEDQMKVVFANVRRTMECAGGSTADIVKCVFFVRDHGHRSYINPEWVAMFPDEADRPARHAVVGPLPDGVHVQCEILGYISENG